MFCRRLQSALESRYCITSHYNLEEAEYVHGKGLVKHIAVGGFMSF